MIAARATRMPRPRDVVDVCAEFARSYELGRSPVIRALDCCVLGRDYAATSWTTGQEAERVAGLLQLRPRMRLLDVGAGSGWPGLFIAQKTGCDVVLADIPLAGLRIAVERATADGLGQRCCTVAADGARLPFNDGAFDAISHSDVLCCMPAKSSMLRECRRVSRPGAVMIFSVIVVAPILAAPERTIALDAGPPFVSLDGDYALLLDKSGWVSHECIDLTAEFARCARALVEGMRANASALAEVYGADDFSERMRRREAASAAIDGGLLKRELFVAIASSSSGGTQSAGFTP